MEKPTRLIASVIWPLAMFLGAVQAAPFDERVKAPKVTTDQAFQAQLKAFFDTYQKKQQEADPAAFIRDRAAHKQWADAHFSVTSALEEGRRLDNLSAFGLIAQPDGSYTIDLKKFPQWDPLDGRLSAFLNLDVLESYVPTLKARGFRDVDVQALRTYVSTHDPRQLTYAEGKPLVESFAKRVQKRNAAGQQPDLEEVMDYRYQKNSVKREARRKWAVDLMDKLDKQRQRILVSFFDEQESERTFGVPTEPLNVTLQSEVQPLLTGAYTQLIAQDELELTRDVARRTEKLHGGQQQ